MIIILVFEFNLSGLIRLTLDFDTSFYLDGALYLIEHSW